MTPIKNQLPIYKIRSMPKVELHRHLDCSMRWSTLIELAQNLKIPLPLAQKDLTDQFLVQTQMQSLNVVLKKFEFSQRVLSSFDVLTRLAYEACEDAFVDGVRLLELRYSPTYIGAKIKGFTPNARNFEKIHEALIRGIQMAEESWPIVVGLICIVQRTLPNAEADKVGQFAIDNPESFVALDLADDETHFEPEKYESLFDKARGAGLGVTIHAGEVPTLKACQNVLKSVNYLGATRIGHGVQIYRDPAVIKFCREKKIVLELCPISNLFTKAVKEMAVHPIRRLFEAGVLVTINSDDPGVFGTRLSDDYLEVASWHGLNEKNFRSLNQTAFESSFLSPKKKNRVRKAFSF